MDAVPALDDSKLAESVQPALKSRSLPARAVSDTAHLDLEVSSRVSA
jgi:hypothetical protein